jgi:hypothetical protein
VQGSVNISLLKGMLLLLLMMLAQAHVHTIASVKKETKCQRTEYSVIL